MSDTDPDLIARFLTDDPDIFNEAMWGWAQRGEDPPEKKPKPQRRKRSRNPREMEYEPDPRQKSKASIDDTSTRVPGINNRELEDEKGEEALTAELASDDWIRDLFSKQAKANEARQARQARQTRGR